LRSDHIRALRDRQSAEGRALLPWSPETLDWYDYFLNIHFPGLQKWVLPELDETYAAKPKTCMPTTTCWNCSTHHQAACYACGAAHGTRHAAGVVQLQNLQNWPPELALSWWGKTAGPRARDPLRQERARVVHGFLRILKQAAPWFRWRNDSLRPSW